MALQCFVLLDLGFPRCPESGGSLVGSGPEGPALSVFLFKDSGPQSCLMSHFLESRVG
ncbi:unnamed protein product [Gulo gulo]|uniref:Uncharacterized protein n=1 Tax=Gulo gulo TaxID=48420 RepID=A0A9X9M706_GULGU|nr:unnamed protein product [Gulo gulo]